MPQWALWTTFELQLEYKIIMNRWNFQLRLFTHRCYTNSQAEAFIGRMINRPFSLIISLFIFRTSVFSVGASSLQRERGYYEERFYQWIQKFPALKPKNGEHFLHMLSNFATNDDIIEETNAQNISFKLGHNKFSHLSTSEFRFIAKMQYQRIILNILDEYKYLVRSGSILTLGFVVF